MFEEVDPRSPVPLYEQIAARLRLAFIAEEFRAGDTLPSVRQLATDLRVNPATVVQAYRDLEQEGFVAMKQGVGTLVLEVPSSRRIEERTRRVRDLAQRTLAEAARLSIGLRELQQALEQESGGQ